MSQWSGPECLFLYIQSTKPKLFTSMCGLHSTSCWRIWPGRLEVWYGIIWIGRGLGNGWFPLYYWCTCWMVGKGEGHGLWGKELGCRPTRVSLLAVLTLPKQVKFQGLILVKNALIYYGGHAWRNFFMACSKLVTMAIYVVKQAWCNEIMPAVYKQALFNEKTLYYQMSPPPL